MCYDVDFYIRQVQCRADQSTVRVCLWATMVSTRPIVESGRHISDCCRSTDEPIYAAHCRMPGHIWLYDETCNAMGTLALLGQIKILRPYNRLNYRRCVRAARIASQMHCIYGDGLVDNFMGQLTITVYLFAVRKQAAHHAHKTSKAASWAPFFSPLSSALSWSPS